jgi:hypothetical protein
MAVDRRLNLAGVRIRAHEANLLRNTGIYARSFLSLEHQGLAKRYVVRGVESGGATEELGHYVTFASTDGDPVEHLQTVDSLRLNGAHAVIIAPALVRIEVFRFRRTCDLCISLHQPVPDLAGRRPRLHAEQIFSATQGYLAVSADDPPEKSRGSMIPQFFSRSGEALAIPERFHNAVIAACIGATCIGCSHSHYSKRQLGMEVGREQIAGMAEGASSD